ncbi:MAG: DUF998 domain-containing protein [Mycobacteriaceae bacterium]|uniref:DUF998 domain-containing protein n=1 Tax=Corynebacterium sp. TaxID=1720 RepID=UPI003F9B1509
MTYRSAGLLLVLSGLVTALGQLIAMLNWRGMYSITDNRISDFTVTECVVLRDNLGTRYVCNPTSLVTNAAFTVAGLLIVVAAVVIARTAIRQGQSSVRVVTAVLAAGGGAYALAGLIPSNVSPWGHDLVMLLFAGLMWTAMLILASAGTMRKVSGREPFPLIYGAYIPITRMMLFVSVVGWLALVVLGPRGMPGLYERLAFDTLTVWLIVIGVGMYSLGGAAEQEARRVAEMEVEWGLPESDDGHRGRRYPGFSVAWGAGARRRREESGNGND